MENPHGFTVLLAAEDIGDDGCQWIEVMPTADKAQNGPWLFTITAEDLEVFAEHIRTNPDRIPVDYDHEGAAGGTGRTEAAGWFTGEAEVREIDGEPRLYARVEWTPQAREQIATKRYRFISPEWTMKERDPEGWQSKAKEFLAATLTNRPFFRQLAPVAEDDPAVTAEEEKSMDELRDALGLAEDATDEQILEAAKAAKEASEKLAEINDKRRDTPRPKGDTVNAAIAEALGLSADADEAAVIAAAMAAREDQKSLAAARDEFGSLSAEAAKSKDLERRLKVLEAKLTNDRVESLLADAVRRGKVAPAEKDGLRKAFGSNPDALDDLIASRPDKLFQLAPRGFGGDVEVGEDLVSVAKEFDSDLADGIDPEGASLHAAAIRSLRAQGKTSYTADEYADALEGASAVVGR